MNFNFVHKCKINSPSPPPSQLVDNLICYGLSKRWDLYWQNKSDLKHERIVVQIRNKSPSSENGIRGLRTSSYVRTVIHHRNKQRKTNILLTCIKFWPSRFVKSSTVPSLAQFKLGSPFCPTKVLCAFTLEDKKTLESKTAKLYRVTLTGNYRSSTDYKNVNKIPPTL